jgi:hypothetical protein
MTHEEIDKTYIRIEGLSPVEQVRALAQVATIATELEREFGERGVKIGRRELIEETAVHAPCDIVTANIALQYRSEDGD